LPIMTFKEIDAVKSQKYVFEGPIIRRMSAEQFADAVSQVIAPVYYAAAFDPESEGLTSNRIWHREIKYDRDVLPDPGPRYFRYVATLPAKEIASAEVLISVDHSYTLYINGLEVSNGTDWKKVDKLDVSQLLHAGENIIAIEGVNEGSIANPAGILFVMKVKLVDGEELLVQSETDWKSTATQPEQDWKALAFEDKDWQAARNFGSRHWDKLLSFNFDHSGHSFARASLVRQHPFMKALGRPSRENVTTNRDDQATLLQALELTNGEYFSQVLEAGADVWLSEYNQNGEKIVDTLYQKSFGRNPTKEEKTIMLSALGEKPDKEAVQDLFWATLLLPEFQFIY